MGDDLSSIIRGSFFAAFYQGAIPHYPHYFDLDDHHRFITGKPMLVCGNTAAMVSETRFKHHFKVLGDQSTHYGPFECGAASVKANDTGNGATCGDVKKHVENKISAVEEKINGLEQIKAALKRLSKQCMTNGPVGNCPFLEALDAEIQREIKNGNHKK